MSNLVSGRNSVDQLLRTTHQHHIFLSGMADRKASFLIAAASVMLTIILGRFVDGGVVPIPLAILGGFSLIATSLAILCIMPRTHKAPPEKEQMNLLFFGEFAYLSADEYWQQMQLLLKDDEAIYKAISEEIYYLGKLLHKKKFRLLELAYRVFLVGIISAAGAFVVQYFI